MQNHDYFELHRQLDGLIYQFDRATRPDGTIGYKRRDADLWIVWHADFGWVAESAHPDDAFAGLSWGVLAQDQKECPPEGDWVSKKGSKAYVYTLIYP